MRLLIWVPSYPRADTPYLFPFVETRIRWYRAAGVECAVQTIGPGRKRDHSGVSVFEDSPAAWGARANAWKADAVAVHFPTPIMRRAFENLEAPAVLWLHGQEALWSFRYERQEAFGADLVKRLRTIPRVFRQILWLRRLIRERGDAVVTVSDWLRERVQRNLGVAPSRLYVIPNPIDTDRFRVVERASATNGAVALRSLSKRVYGFELAIRALARVPRSTMGFTIIGEGAELARYRTLAARLQAPVEFCPQAVPNESLPSLFQRFGIYFNTAQRETHGVTMCEAMATGMPVVGQRVAAIPEYVRDGKDGYLAPRGDRQGLRERLLELGSNPRLRNALGASASEYVREKCSAQKVVATELSVLQGALARGR